MHQNHPHTLEIITSLVYEDLREAF